MSRNILWIFLVIAPLVSASSLETLEATCNGSGPLGCSGIYTNGPDVSFSFSGFFDGFNQRFGPMPPNPSGIVLAPGGTHGGDTTYQGHLCNNDVANHGGWRRSVASSKPRHAVRHRTFTRRCGQHRGPGYGERIFLLGRGVCRTRPHFISSSIRPGRTRHV